MQERSKKHGLVPCTLDEGFFPNFVRHFSLFDEESMSPMLRNDKTNVSLSEDDKNVYIEANLPGIKEKDIEITQDKGVLWIRGEAKTEEENQKRKYYHKAASSFSYRFAIPGNIDESREPVAIYENGVIKIAYHKRVKETPKKIHIATKTE